VLLAPRTERGERLIERDADLGQRVHDLGWHLFVDGAFDDAVAFELA
jgi:hypothetical protein